jgi:putative Mg2+ transporter-C (MgtC) family protein
MNWFSDGWGDVARDFSDLYNAAQIVRVVARMLVAAALGGALGYERERTGKSPGLRTHALVAMGAALFVMAPQLMGASTDGLTRVMQGLLTGVGFLGAGVIWRDASTHGPRGLTTAAGIWLTAGIGMAAGLGRVGLAVLTTVLALVVLVLLPMLHSGDKERPGETLTKP